MNSPSAAISPVSRERDWKGTIRHLPEPGGLPHRVKGALHHSPQADPG